MSRSVEMIAIDISRNRKFSSKNENPALDFQTNGTKWFILFWSLSRAVHKLDTLT